MLILIRLVVFEVMGLLLGCIEDKSVFSVVALLQTFIGSVRWVEVATLTVQEPALRDSDCAIEIASCENWNLRFCLKFLGKKVHLIWRRSFTAREERFPQLEVWVLMVVRIFHRHRTHVTDVASYVSNTAYASLIVLIILILMTHLAFSLTKAINDKEDKRERYGGSYAGCD